MTVCSSKRKFRCEITKTFILHSRRCRCHFHSEHPIRWQKPQFAQHFLMNALMFAANISSRFEPSNELIIFPPRFHHSHLNSTFAMNALLPSEGVEISRWIARPMILIFHWNRIDDFMKPNPFATFRMLFMDWHLRLTLGDVLIALPYVNWKYIMWCWLLLNHQRGTIRFTVMLSSHYQPIRRESRNRNLFKCQNVPNLHQMWI